MLGLRAHGINTADLRQQESSVAPHDVHELAMAILAERALRGDNVLH
jgi:hypothetical protein